MTPVASFSEKERFALSRLRQILRDSGLMRASLIERRHSCGRRGCRCLRSKRGRHLSWYATQSAKGMLRQKFIPRERLEEVRHWVERYGETRQLLDKVSDEHWKRLDQRQK